MTFKRAAIAGLVLLMPGLAHAVPLTWTLNDAVFSDGGTATGSFVWDADTETFGAYEFTVSGGDTATFSPLTYNTANAAFGPIHAEFDAGSYRVRLFRFVTEVDQVERNLYVSVDAPLTNAGGLVGLDFVSPYSAGECFTCAPYRPFVAGNLSAEGVSGVPEPAAWGLMVLGFGGLGAALRRRRDLFGAAA